MNKYHNEFHVEGPADALSEIYTWMRTNEPAIREKSTCDDFWFDDLLETKGINTSEFSIKSACIWRYGINDAGILEIMVESRGGGALEYVWAIKDHFPGVKLFYVVCSFEAGVAYTNDVECKYHAYNYALVLKSDVDEKEYWAGAWVFSAEQEGKTFKTIEEVAQYASEVLGRDVPRDWEQVLKELDADGLLVDSSCILDRCCR